MVKPVISALSNLRPVQIVNIRTGELHSWESYLSEALSPLLDWVVGETKRMYEADTTKVLEDAKNLQHNPAEYARQKNHHPSFAGLSREVRAQSRLASLTSLESPFHSAALLLLT